MRLLTKQKPTQVAKANVLSRFSTQKPYICLWRFGKCFLGVRLVVMAALPALYQFVYSDCRDVSSCIMVTTSDKLLGNDSSTPINLSGMFRGDLTMCSCMVAHQNCIGRFPENSFLATASFLRRRSWLRLLGHQSEPEISLGY